MALSTRLIRTRIKSVRSTRKITRAMELVSAAKMRRATASALASRMYARLAGEIVTRLSDKIDLSLHPLLAAREEAEKITVIVVSSNRGLAGAFNGNVVQVSVRAKGDEYITYGRRGADGLRRAGTNIIADFQKTDIAKSILEIRPIVKIVSEGFINGTYREVKVVYTDYVSALVQKATLKTLLPFTNYELQVTSYGEEYIFEPSAKEVLDDLLPRMVELQLWQMVLESDASEHSARMLAMRNATSAAGDMIFDLTLAFNSARQAGITREIAEISAGRAAVEG